MTADPAGTGPEVEITGGGEPSEEEVAAITAAAWAATASATVAAEPTAGRPPRWRFSGRWWSKPVPLRRSRPW